MKKKIMFIVTIALIIIFIGLYFFYKQNKKIVEKTVSSYEVKAKDFEHIITAKGKIEAKDLRKIYMATSQKVSKLNKKVGDKVNKGESILTFDLDYRVRIEREVEILKLDIINAKLSLENLNHQISELSLIENENNLNSIKLKKEKNLYEILLDEEEVKNSKKILDEKIEVLKEKEELLNSGGISRNEYRKYFDDKTTAEEEYKRKNLTLENLKKDINLNEKEIVLAQKNLDYAKQKITEDKETRNNQIQQERNSIKKLELQFLTRQDELNKLKDQLISPVTGTILTMIAEENYMVDPEKAIAEIADISQQKVVVEVPTYELKGIAVGQKGRVQSELLDKPLDATVTKITSLAKETQNNGVTDNVVEVELILDENSNILRPGYEISVDIIKENKNNALVIPVMSIFREDDKAYVYKINNDNAVEKIEVSVGLENISELEVTGLDEGENIITNLSPDIEIGDIVKVEE